MTLKALSNECDPVADVVHRGLTFPPAIERKPIIIQQTWNWSEGESEASQNLR